MLIPSTKLCKHCKYFLPGKQHCIKFGTQDLVHGTNNYESASYVRSNDKQCGKDAIYFEKNDIRYITLPYHFIKDNWSLILPISLQC